MNETRKIFGDETLKITATAARVPVLGGHSESVNVSFKNEMKLDEVRSVLKSTPGVKIVDAPDKNLYPMPINAQGNDWVYVGRLRIDESQAQTLNMWIVSDNLRKGAATNTIQILKYLWNEGWLHPGY